MEEFKHAQQGLDKLFDRIGVDRRAKDNKPADYYKEGNRSERRQQEKIDRRTAKTSGEENSGVTHLAAAAHEAPAV